MLAKIWKHVDGKDIEYGTYDFNTSEERNYVNVLAESVRDTEKVDTWVERIEE